MGTVFTFVAAADLVAAAPVLVAGDWPAFNGFSAAGLVATLLASEGAGFFELGIRPRYGKKRQAESQARRHADSATTPVHRHGQNNWERGSDSSTGKMSGEHLVCSPCGY
ncbi:MULTISPECIES: hypothetical protein [unclassified Variovorax]|uniref:hypothetical protein n=1 Tax=unclassified Variovorax TaxID=663243 RepID=UPI001F054AF5|nr:MULTISPECIES: hypothetical protein [unclassified Variovorax]